MKFPKNAGISSFLRKGGGLAGEEKAGGGFGIEFKKEGEIFGMEGSFFRIKVAKAAAAGDFCCKVGKSRRIWDLKEIRALLLSILQSL